MNSSEPAVSYNAGDVVVIFVHGINTTQQNYYEAMRDRVIEQLPLEHRGRVIFRAVFWADVVRGRQQEYVTYATAASDLRMTSLHRLVVEGLGDAAAYQKSPSVSSAYREIQERLKRTIKDVTIGQNDRRPLIFIAHSLGCHIVSSFAWDMHRNRTGAPTFEQLSTFAGFVTMGSNQPLFTFNIGPQNVRPITLPYDFDTAPAFPGAILHDEVQREVRWLNFYSTNDPLGYPLKPLNDAYDQDRRIIDRHVIAEGLWWKLLLPWRLRPLNALRAHGGYWRNPRVILDVASLIRRISDADKRGADRELWKKVTSGPYT